MVSHLAAVLGIQVADYGSANHLVRGFRVVGVGLDTIGP
jgi:hypothetical protein